MGDKIWHASRDGIVFEVDHVSNFGGRRLGLLRLYIFSYRFTLSNQIICGDQIWRGDCTYPTLGACSMGRTLSPQPYREIEYCVIAWRRISVDVGMSRDAVLLLMLLLLTHRVSVAVVGCDVAADWCSQICEDISGRYQCRCLDGYRLANDHHSCVPADGKFCRIYAVVVSDGH